MRRVEANRRKSFGICALILMMSSACAGAQTPPRFLSIDRYVASGGVQLSGGAKARPEDWHSIAISTGPLKCTAVLVGRQVVVTSAHCIDAAPAAFRAQVVLGTVTFGARTYKLDECAMHPDYEIAGPNGKFPRSSRDVALCRTKYPVDGVDPESFGDDALDAGARVLLMGLGCYDLKVVGAKLDKKEDPPEAPVLRIGDQSIERTALALGSSGQGLARTVSRGGAPNVCPGDSGGPVLTGVTAASPVKGRRVSGLNSAFHGKWGVNEPETVFYSYLSPINTSVRAWAKKWSDDRGLQICGLQLGAGVGGCRL